MCPSFRMPVWWRSVLLFVLVVHRVELGLATGTQIPSDDSPNLIQNADFEQDLDPYWQVSRADIEFSTDAPSGSRSIRVTNRSNRFGGVSQKVYNVSGNSMYFMSAYFKFTEDVELPTLFYEVRLFGDYQESNGGELKRFAVARFSRLRANDGWHLLGGDLTVPDVDIDYISIYVEVRELSISYMMDTASLVLIPRDPQWKERADAEILKHRTSSLTIRADFPKNVPYCQCTIQVDQISRDFGFGQAVAAQKIVHRSDFGENYRSFLTNNFNWVVFGNDMKWRPMEPTKGEIKFSRVDKAMDFLLDNKLTVRGHSVLWGVEENNPSWVKELEGEELKTEIWRRVDYLLTQYNGTVAEWDVMNEWLHGTWYEEKTGDPLIQDKVYKQCRDIDPTTKLFLNDYQALRTGDYTTACVKQANDLKSRGIPIDGLGFEGHLRDYVPPEILRNRVAVGASAGMPITITEMSVHDTNVSERARRLDEALRIYFSNPAVQAIVFWFFSDQKGITFEDDAILFEGADFKPNEAGQVLMDRMAEWQTHKNITPGELTVSEALDAYHGRYQVQMMCKDQVVVSELVDVNPGIGTNVTLTPTADDFPEFEDDASVCP